MFEHEDRLAEIDKSIGLAEKTELVHLAMKEQFPFIDHIAAAVYDAKTDTVKTFLDSGGKGRPLAHYEAKLSEASSLREILAKGRPRVVNDLEIFSQGAQTHTRKIAGQGYRASYTLPMVDYGRFFGFLFFNSYQRGAFNEEVLGQIDTYAHLLSLTIIHELSSIQILLATVKTARDMAYARDTETGGHLDRMSRFARLIARKVADTHHLTDEYIEKLFIFAPLHDIGKIAIPDEVLLKPGGLDEGERAIMKTHTTKGRNLIDSMLVNFNLDHMQHVDILRNIAEFHHESIDGSGYPHGRRADEIPIEARIAAVADIFDALTSRRPYKIAWSNDDAFAMLKSLSGITLDAGCVDALIRSRDGLEEIQRHFSED